MTDDDLNNRLASRFDDEGSDEQTKGNNRDKSENRDKHVKSAWRTKNIKQSEEWKAMQFVLPEELVEDLDDEWRRIQYELGDDNLQKDRHFKPLVVQTALDTLREMDEEGLEAAFEDLVRKEE